MRGRHVRRSGYRSRDYFAQRDNSRRGRSGFSRNTWRFQGGARWLQADSVAFRPGHRRQRRATGEPHSIDGALLCRLPDAKSAGEHRGFASRHIALKSDFMPLYMDIHNLLEGTTPEDVAKAHAKDMETQRKYGVEYTKYWLNEKAGKVFCLCHAPNAEAAKQVHREAHGMVADKIIEIQPELEEGFLGGIEVNQAGAAVVPGATNERDSGIRTILFTDIVESTT